MSSAVGTHTTDQDKSDKSADINVSHSQYMSFVINDRHYALALSNVAEITPYSELNQMPHTPECVEGLLDLRGQVLPVVSLRTKMGLPRKANHSADNILILTHDDSRIGVLVDQVESVITASEENQMPVTPLLEGKEGAWVREILLLNGKVILVLEPESIVRISENERESQKLVATQINDVELMLDEGLRKLIALADSKEDEKIFPQVNSVIEHTESEMTKVIDRVEAMLTSTDTVFTGIGRFKQEVAMTGVQGFDELNELDTVAHDLQDKIFDVINQLQYQDIVRQKLEKVLSHILAMNEVIAHGLG
ncbi:MAG: chemotaxis protein CheW [Holophagales bacterium]|nr:chemotaxis protein CheW [Holophagales bacterium]